MEIDFYNSLVKAALLAMNEREQKMANEEMMGTPVGLEFRGDKIVLPEVNGEPMAYDMAIRWIQRKATEEDEIIGIHVNFPGAPLDGLVAFHRAMAEKFGWTSLVPTPSFFGSKPPVMVGVPVGPGKTLQAPLGRMRVPGIEGCLQSHLKVDENPAFVIAGEVKRKYQPQVDEIIAATRKFLKEQSIYKGQAVRVSWEWQRNHCDFDVFANAPKYMELDPSLESTLIFGDKVANDLDIGLFTPIEQSAACRKYGVPLKRGVLLYGPYGTGKTLTANITAIKARRNNWTFVYLDSVLDLKQGLQFAQLYAPSVVFCEDIDRVMSGQRSLELDEVLNTLDGVDTKNGEIITVFTTNHVERLNPAVLRMGRLDALVEVAPPDAGAAERLVRLYSRGLLEGGADLTLIGERLAGKIPAFIREVTERAKIAAIARLQGGDIEGHVTQVDLLAAATAMETHNDMIWQKPTKHDEHGRTLKIVMPNGAIPSLVPGLLSAYAPDVSQAGSAQ